MTTKIIYKNLAKEATVQTTTANSAYPATNLLKDQKSYVWRSTSVAQQSIALVWENAVIVNSVVLAFTNLTAASKIRVLVFENPLDTVPLYDSGYINRLAEPLSDIDWGDDPLGLTSYSGEKSSTVSVWLPQAYETKRVAIQIVDDTITDGYYEVGCVVVGKSWAPSLGADSGASVSIEDTSTNKRADSGDLRTERMCQYRTMNVDLSSMSKRDRKFVWDMIARNGKHSPIFVALLADDVSPMLEQSAQIYGKLTNVSAITLVYNDLFNTSLSLEEI